MVAKRIAVIGAGSIGQRHANNLRTLDIEVDHIPWRSFDAENFTRRRDLSAAVIATSTQVRLEITSLCAQMNLPIYVEKPLAYSLGQVEAIYSAAAPVADRSMVGFMMRYHPVFAALREEDLGDIYSFSFEVGHDVRQWRPNWLFRKSYAANPEGGGVLLDLSHEVDMATMLFPGLELQSVQCLGHPDFPNVDFATTLHFAAPGGPIGTVTMDYLSPVSIRKARLRGLRRHLEIDFLTPDLTRITHKNLDVVPFASERNDMFLSAMRDFCKLVDYGDSAAAEISPFAPLLGSTRATNILVAEAWRARQFRGSISIDMG